MILIDDRGLPYEVDKNTRQLQSPFSPTPVAYHTVARLFVGSPGTVFYDEYGNEILETGRVVSIDPPPVLDEITGEDGNVTFWTSNSVYEVNQEQKLFRRLGGNNRSAFDALDGDWVSYDEITDLEVGRRPIVWFSKEDRDKSVGMSKVRKMTGTLVPAQ